jgi:hypothetical protein
MPHLAGFGVADDCPVLECDLIEDLFVVHVRFLPDRRLHPGVRHVQGSTTELGFGGGEESRADRGLRSVDAGHDSVGVAAQGVERVSDEDLADSWCLRSLGPRM